MRYQTYRCTVHRIESDLVDSTHVLMAGSTGSGKSVLIKRILRCLCADGAQLVLIDPKVVELGPWKDMVNVVSYASSAPSALSALRSVIKTMDKRYRQMGKWETTYSGCPLWVIIDEYADLVTTEDRKACKEIKTLVQRIAQLGRAANIHLLVATQRPTTDVIDGRIKVNFTTQVALHVRSAQDSRNIIGIPGAENLRVGECIVANDFGDMLRYNVPFITQAECRDCAEYMEHPRRIA